MRLISIFKLNSQKQQKKSRTFHLLKRTQTISKFYNIIDQLELIAQSEKKKNSIPFVIKLNLLSILQYIQLYQQQYLIEIRKAVVKRYIEFTELFHFTHSFLKIINF